MRIDNAVFLKSNRSHFAGARGFLCVVGKLKGAHMLCIKKKRLISFMNLEILAYSTFNKMFPPPSYKLTILSQ